ncbi:MAG: TonB-dependent receptor [Pseudomonadota bacterium]
MTKRISQRRFWRASTFALAALALPTSLAAQDTDEEDEVEETEDGQEIGTVDIGESVRAIQTDTATPTTVINREEILDRQANTVAELVDSVPGVSLVNGSTPIGSSISIRGFGFNQVFGTDSKVQIQIDGAASNPEEIYRLGNQIFTEPDLYKNIEVIRGTVGSFEYGSGIIGGLIRLETIDAFDLTGGEKGIAANQTFGFFTNGDGFQSSSTVAIAPSDRVELLGNFTYREQDNQTDGRGDEIGNGEFELPSFLIKGGVYLDPDKEHYLRASFQQSTTADRDVPLDTFITETDFFGNVDRDTTSQVAILRYNYNPVENDAVDLSAQFSYSNQDIEQTFIPGSSTLGPSFDPFVSGLGNADLQFETYQVLIKNASFFNTGSVQHNLRTGVDFRRRVRADANSAPGGRDNRIAFFIVDDIALTPGLTVTPALRYEAQDVVARPSLDDGSDFSGSRDALMGGISGRYEFGNGFSVFTSWARSRNLPILDDLENPVLRAQIEQGDTFEIGGAFNRIGVFGSSDALSFKVNYYDSDIDNLSSTRGVASVETEGFEGEASYATRSGFYFDVNASIITGDEIASDGTAQDWRNLPQNTFQAAFGKRFGDLLNLRWEAVYTEDRDQDLLLDPPVANGFNVHNIRANLTPSGGFLDGVSLRVSVENLFDTFYQPARALRAAPGRNFKFTLGKRF